MSYQAQAGYPGQAGEPPLDHPWYGIGFVDATKRVFKKYATFSGRASRGEYWWWVLASSILFTVLYVILLVSLVATSTSGRGSMTAVSIVLSIVMGLVGLAVIVPSIAVAVRRLHDAGYSGWLYLLSLIPGASIVVIVLCAMPTSPQAAKYGPPYPESYGQGAYPQIGYYPPGSEQGGYQQGYPQQPGYSQQPGYPEQPGYSQQPGYPEQPGYSQQPGSPEQAGYPQQGGAVPPAQGGYPPAGGDQPGSANPPQY